MEKTILNREAVLAAQDVQREYVDVPEWNGGVYVQTISARAGLEMVSRRSEADEKNQAVVGIELILAQTVVDEAGNLLFNAEDLPALMDKSRTAIDRIVAAAMRLNKMGTWAEDTEKN